MASFLSGLPQRHKSKTSPSSPEGASRPETREIHIKSLWPPRGHRCGMRIASRPFTPQPLGVTARLSVDDGGPGTCGAVDVAGAGSVAVDVRLDDEVVSPPVVCHLHPVRYHPENPGVVTETVDLPVSGDVSESPAHPREKALKAAIASCAMEESR